MRQNTGQAAPGSRDETTCECVSARRQLFVHVTAGFPVSFVYNTSSSCFSPSGLTVDFDLWTVTDVTLLTNRIKP